MRLRPHQEPFDEVLLSLVVCLSRAYPHYCAVQHHATGDKGAPDSPLRVIEDGDQEDDGTSTRVVSADISVSRRYSVFSPAAWLFPVTSSHMAT